MGSSSADSASNPGGRGRPGGRGCPEGWDPPERRLPEAGATGVGGAGAGHFWPVLSYAVSGLVLESASAFPTLEELAGASRAKTPRVRFSTCSGASRFERSQLLYEVPHVDGPHAFLSAAMDGAVVVLRVHGFADFEIERHGDGATIRCFAPAQLEPQAIEQLLVDQVLPRTMYLLGRPCFHASAVALDDGRVLAFAAPSQTGKSTLCAALCRRGARLVCDDSLALREQAQEIVVYPSYGSLRMWPAAADGLFGPAHNLPSATPRTAKLRFEAGVARGHLHLSRFVLLERTSGRPALSRLSGAKAFAALLPHVHRLDIGGAASREAEHTLLAAVAKRIPVERLAYPHRFEALGAVVDLLIA